MAEKRGADDAYVMQPMFTYLGNKRKLLSFLREAVEEVAREVGGPLRALDAFCGRYKQDDSLVWASLRAKIQAQEEGITFRVWWYGEET